MSQELLANGRQVKPYLLLAELEVNRRDFKMALQHISGAQDVKRDDPRAWATQGHLNFLQEKWEDAKDAYETVLSLTTGRALFLNNHRAGSSCGCLQSPRMYLS